jgi:hypothetical protein
MADAGRRLSEELREEAQWWLFQTWGDQGLRLHAERTAALLERAAKLAALHEAFCAAFWAYWNEGSASRTVEQAANLDATQSALIAFDSGPEEGR